MKTLIAAAVIYIAGFLGTYGHAFNTSKAKYAGEKTVEAFVCAAFWPLYLSAEAWK
jgi:hypothetical protein